LQNISYVSGRLLSFMIQFCGRQHVNANVPAIQSEEDQLCGQLKKRTSYSITRDILFECGRGRGVGPATRHVLTRSRPAEFGLSVKF
jgi:hypothetical protein